MSLRQWQTNGWLKPHETSRNEIEDLFKIVERDIEDARAAISDDWRFGIAYNAALKLCTILLYAEGFRSERTLQHYRTIMAMPLILGNQRKSDAIYLDACRAKRNTVEYDCVGGASRSDADELIEFVKDFYEDVSSWLKKTHPQLALC